MRNHWIAKLTLGVTLVGVLAGGCQLAGDAFKAKFMRSEELTAPAAGITTLEVATNVGKVQVDAADVGEVHIEAEIKVKDRTEEGAQELADQVRIVAEPSGETLHIKTIKPAGLKDRNLSVDFTITAPAGLALKCSTNVGDIRTTGLAGPVTAQTSVGSITCEGLLGEADLHTNVGDIRVEYASDAPAAMRVSASTNVGSIDLTGPKEISASLGAEANVGSIDTDRPLTVTGPLKRSIQASLGNGDGLISLRTNVGSIHIR